MSALLASLDAAAPPEGLSRPMQALWWLAKGNYAMGPEWERAHSLCQSGEGQRDLDLVHALAHLIEGDLSNADYWYRRAGVRRISQDLRAEWQAIAKRLEG